MLMQVNLRELIYGHQSLLEKSTNNNKYLNMLIFKQQQDGAENEEDPDAYLMPNSEEGEQDLAAQKTLKEAITKINELKYSCGDEI
jgi:hypothetical protein